MHDHDHSHHHHGHLRAESDSRLDIRFSVGIALNAAFVVSEVIFGVIADSMALLTDAAHNLFDVLGLLLAWWAIRLARKRPTEQRTYGYRKVTILAALANSMLILVAIGAIVWEAALRLGDPPKVQGQLMMLVAGIGVLINTGSALLFRHGRQHDVNLRAAFVHLAADAAISVGVVVAGLLIIWTGTAWIDPVVSLAISATILVGTWSLLKSSFNLAMDAVPPHIRIREVESHILEHSGVLDVHDLHIWAMSSTETALTAHLITERPWSTQALRDLSGDLQKTFGLNHVTIQIEPADGCEEPCPQGEEGSL
jgi:cobalt-zinc-cadmium efflux system protein